MVRIRHVRSFKDLEIYQAAFRLSTNIFKISKSFPKEETYSLTDQILRSSRAVGAGIAESWGKRRYPKHFINKLTNADSEQLETQHWLEVALSCQYIDEECFRELNSELEAIGRMLHSMIRKAHQFCGSEEPDLLEDSSG